jgi:hypothetical protein
MKAGLQFLTVFSLFILGTYLLKPPATSPQRSISHQHEMKENWSSLIHEQDPLAPYGKYGHPVSSVSALIR